MLTLSEGDFLRIVAFVGENFGISLIKKRALVQGRLALMIEKQGYSSFREYVDFIIANPGSTECQRMLNRISTNHTFFFREPRCFDHLMRVAVPRLISRGVTDIKIWCAASSTGQECYTAAMVMEQALLMYPCATFHILASDINTEVLETGLSGIYPIAELEVIPEHYRRLYCRRRNDDTFEISDHLRKYITWRQINLVKPLRSVPVQHIIFCRNVMIYFDTAVKEALTDELFKLVADGGFVYVGNTETLDMKRTRFAYEGPAVFEKKGSETR